MPSMIMCIDTSEILDGPRSIVFDQAEDRMWVQMALLRTLMGALPD